jgi:hypothetical protein
MDKRTMLLKHLDQAREHPAIGSEQLAEQLAPVEQLERAGQKTGESRRSMKMEGPIAAQMVWHSGRTLVQLGGQRARRSPKMIRNLRLSATIATKFPR